ncbi:hypothetical protein XELAEV_18039009mg [Xenopus laevis]|uniref:Uncharacterized protein n=1 Tax=Xenopus laevis TaxID=8355 RepID=A0A974C740_XENLA|nr:hypothetical protein XELAEV_18039009mg [Xenopus laevis]
MSGRGENDGFFTSGNNSWFPEGLAAAQLEVVMRWGWARGVLLDRGPNFSLVARTVNKARSFFSVKLMRGIKSGFVPAVFSHFRVRSINAR